MKKQVNLLAYLLICGKNNKGFTGNFARGEFAGKTTHESHTVLQTAAGKIHRGNWSASKSNFF